MYKYCFEVPTSNFLFRILMRPISTSSPNPPPPSPSSSWSWIQWYPFLLLDHDGRSSSLALHLCLNIPFSLCPAGRWSLCRHTQPGLSRYPLLLCPARRWSLCRHTQPDHNGSKSSHFFCPRAKTFPSKAQKLKNAISEIYYHAPSTCCREGTDEIGGDGYLSQPAQ
jgi:hypothetical protein